MLAVKLRLDGLTVAAVSQRTGLSAPTVSAAWKAFREGGWAAVPVRPRGRLKGQANVLDATVQQLLWDALYAGPAADQPGWNSAGLAAYLRDEHGVELTQRAIEHWWESERLKHEPWPLEALAKQRSQRGRWYRQSVAPLFAKLEQAEQRWQGGVRKVAHPHRLVYQLYLHGPRGRLWMRCYQHPPVASDYLTAMGALSSKGPVALVFHGAWFSASPEVTAWLAQQTMFWLVQVPADSSVAS
ncbi:helix-turn-helix domain-containing protein [Vreelandella nanhaiensis]|uniref:Helix-turn-helix domain-containing protein n=1 Tax=Vreelandella nanhaiensis TaxID=1258546 RepID=A0A433KKC9_9GAMM|nr:helix-turn-helix domain-containing protein [Halomonas nanhaiensis]RUR29988.1 helix-turn-helix domain-containing protein [Halomonas nanhaiensis]